MDKRSGLEQIIEKALATQTQLWILGAVHSMHRRVTIQIPASDRQYLLYTSAMEIKHSQPVGIRPVAHSLTVNIVSLWIAIPLFGAFWIFFSLISILFNNSGNARQQVVPFLNNVLFFDLGLVFC
jgi:hypothetical protein